MERNNKNPIIIEFNGLPGAGKTTIAGALQKALQNIGITSFRYYYRSKFFKSTRWLLLMPNYWQMIKEASCYAKLLPKRKYLMRILWMIHFVRMYREFIKDKPAEYLIIDQGIIQSFISLAHQDKLPSSIFLARLLKVLRLEELHLIVVNCYVNKDTSNERILSRPFNGCRVESMTIEDRQKTLEIQTENFFIIRDTIKTENSVISIVDLNTEESIHTSCEQILKQLLI